MKKIVLILITVTFIYACKDKKKAEVSSVKTETYDYFGEKIDDEKALSGTEIAKRYKILAIGDTLVTKVSASINEVCSKKGCWMKLNLGDDEEVMVRFKDYGFFMPLDAKGDVIVSGKAYVTEVSIDDLRHYAEDAGKTKEEINAITAPEKAYAFEANGVLLKE